MAHALSRPGLGHGEGPRHRATTPATASAWRSISARRLRPVVRLPLRVVGALCAGFRRARPARHRSSRNGYPFSIMVNAEGSASSTRARISATTRTRSTAAWCWSSRAATPGTCSIRRSSTCCTRNIARKGRTKVQADTLEELVARMEDVHPGQFLRTVREFNAAIRREVPFNPNIKDGRRTEGLALEKSNWANAIQKPPYSAYAVTCGITFTFGGLKIDTATRVLDIADAPLPGLYAAGELVGGLFYLQLSRQLGTHGGLGVRAHRRQHRRPRRQEFRASWADVFRPSTSSFAETLKRRGCPRRARA